MASNINNSTYLFPEAKVMKESLSKNESLNLPYYQEKGITKVITELAIKRLSVKNLMVTLKCFGSY